MSAESATQQDVAIGRATTPQHVVVSGLTRPIARRSMCGSRPRRRRPGHQVLDGSRRKQKAHRSEDAERASRGSVRSYAVPHVVGVRPVKQTWVRARNEEHRQREKRQSPPKKTALEHPRMQRPARSRVGRRSQTGDGRPIRSAGTPGRSPRLARDRRRRTTWPRFAR